MDKPLTVDEVMTFIENRRRAMQMGVAEFTEEAGVSLGFFAMMKQEFCRDAVEEFLKVFQFCGGDLIKR